MKSLKHWKKYSLLCSTALLLVTGSVVAYGIYQEYQSMQVLQIESFDSYWKKNVFDENSKLINDIDDQQLSELKNLVETPTDNSRYKLAEMSISLKKLIDPKSNLEIDQILSIMSDYQLDRDVDKDFPEQREKNLKILETVEKFVDDLSGSLHSLTVSDDQTQILFDRSLTSHEDLQKIETSIRWSKLDKYNSMIENLNSEIKSQILENEDYRKQKTIIDLKQNLDDFIALIESTKEKLKTRYVSVKDVKTMIERLSSIKDSNSDWLTDSTILDYRGVNEDRSSTLSKKFYLDNDLNSLASLASLADSIRVEVSVRSERLNVRDKSEESKTSEISVKSSADFTSLKDGDLIEIESLKNLSFKMNVKQVEKIFKEESSRSSSNTDSSSDSEVRSSDSRTTSSLERGR